MPKIRLLLKQKAKEDLKDIWRYTYEKWGVEKADQYFDMFKSKFDALKDNPEIGTSCDYIRPGYRQYQINKHIAFYIITPEYIQIIRIIHEKMDFKKHLQ